jgi:hypothetical protein
MQRAALFLSDKEHANMPTHTNHRNPCHRHMTKKKPAPSIKSDLSQAEIIAKENARIAATLKQYAWEDRP